MRRSDLVQHKEREKGANTRTSQIIFGERQHLLRVLDSLEGTELPIARMQQERRILEELIHARTRDLNQINTAWDEKIGLVLSADAKPEMLEKLVKQAPLQRRGRIGIKSYEIPQRLAAIPAQPGQRRSVRVGMPCHIFANRAIRMFR